MAEEQNADVSKRAVPNAWQRDIIVKSPFVKSILIAINN
jgi:hypothetical protein